LARFALRTRDVCFGTRLIKCTPSLFFSDLHVIRAWELAYACVKIDLNYNFVCEYPKNKQTLSTFIRAKVPFPAEINEYKHIKL